MTAGELGRLVEEIRQRRTDLDNIKVKAAKDRTCLTYSSLLEAPDGDKSRGVYDSRNCC
jgi:hypothetical protein